jgi:hypothetical protein
VPQNVMSRMRNGAVAASGRRLAAAVRPASISQLLDSEPQVKGASAQNRRPILPRSLHLPLASTESRAREKLNKNGVRLWT